MGVILGVHGCVPRLAPPHTHTPCTLSLQRPWVTSPRARPPPGPGGPGPVQGTPTLLLCGPLGSAPPTWASGLWPRPHLAQALSLSLSGSILTAGQATCPPTQGSSGVDLSHLTRDTVPPAPRLHLQHSCTPRHPHAGHSSCTVLSPDLSSSTPVSAITSMHDFVTIEHQNCDYG